jgi:hypothetical protein
VIRGDVVAAVTNDALERFRVRDPLANRHGRAGTGEPPPPEPFANERPWIEIERLSRLGRRRCACRARAERRR